MTRVLHVITGLERGGAQSMLREVVVRGARYGLSSEVVSLTHGGAVAEEIRDAGISVRSLKMSYGTSALTGGFRLGELLRGTSADVIQSWLYHADLAVGLAMGVGGMRRPRRPVVWGLHVASPAAKGIRASTRGIAKICASLSGRLPKVVVACAPSVAAEHVRLGYASSSMAVISNGVDTNHFAPDAELGQSVRQRLGLAQDELLIACVARDHPVKDTETLLASFARVASADRRVCLALCGKGLDPTHRELRELAAALGVGERVLLCGESSDTRGLLNAADLVVLTSVSEALPMVLLEAMSCGTPVCATDVGDCAECIGRVDAVAPPTDVSAVSATWKSVLEMAHSERLALGAKLRHRVQQNYSIDDAVQKYGELYERVAN